MATVYLARDVKHDRQVAVKVLRPDLAATVGVERFLQEIKVSANLTHPHILPLHDSGEADGFLYYVMPYVKGESLRDRLSAKGELPIGDAVRIIREVADALAHAHREGVVHRDIKPDNVMLTGRHAVVMDFGVAKAVSQATGRQGITTVGVALGTPAYMAPEQATADPNIDHRVDIYALGAMAYEMLTGRPPFTGTTAQALLAAHATQAPAPITTTVPPALAQLVSKCLEKNPADRFQTADELLPLVEVSSGDMTPADTMPLAKAAPPLRTRSRYLMPFLGTAAAVVLVLLGTFLGGGGTGDPAVDAKSLAVLPFESIRSDEESRAFTVGIHDDLLTQLSKIRDLKVISRTSVLEYAGRTDMIEIGAELGVAFLMEGSVQRAGNQLRMNVQLIDARREGHLWAETYNAELSVENIFAIQSDLARRIAAALEATLSPEEEQRIEARPTEDLAAYDFYLRCREYDNRPGYGRENMESAQQMCERAVSLDPEFAQAHAGLSRVHGRMLWFQYDPSEARREAARAAAQRALELDPNLPEAHVAMGYYHYYGKRDYARALQEFAIAERGLPGDVQLRAARGYVQRRLGDFEGAAEDLVQVARLGPRDPRNWFDVGLTLIYLGRYEEAELHFARALALAPDFADAAIWRGVASLNRDGRTEPLRRVLANLSDDEQTLAPVPVYRWLVAILDRDYDEALQIFSGDDVEVVESQVGYAPASLFNGWVYAVRDNAPAARAAFDSARVRLEAALQERPDDARVHSALGLAYAGLGRGEEAVREGRRAVNLMPVSRDAVLSPWFAWDLSVIYATMGDPDAALAELEGLLSRPGFLGPQFILRDARLDGIRDNPGFRALEARYLN
jgi:serine/threonine-protein kinase